ncbi:MAG: SH3 domain-containing protein [Leptospirales bacterium]
MSLKKSSQTVLYVLLTVLMSFLFCKKEAPVEIKVGDTVYLSGDKVRLRNGPSTKSAAVTEFRLGDKMQIAEISAETDTIGGVTTYWYKIQTDKKNSGWIFGKFVSLKTVDTVEATKKKLKGTYYYCKSKEKNDCTHILEINGNKYEHKLFDTNIGITDYYTGTVSYSSKHILLTPKTRIARYAFYQYSLPYEQQYDYDAYAYGTYSEDLSTLSEIDNLGMDEPWKLYILTCNEKIFLPNFANGNCGNTFYSYYP